jgi:hypothetical protein
MEMGLPCFQWAKFHNCLAFPGQKSLGCQILAGNKILLKLFFKFLLRNTEKYSKFR